MQQCDGKKEREASRRDVKVRRREKKGEESTSYIYYGVVYVFSIQFLEPTSVYKCYELYARVTNKI